MSIKRRSPHFGQPVNKVGEGDVAVLDNENDRDTPAWRPSRVERRDWRGEGVVSTNHTD